MITMELTLIQYNFLVTSYDVYAYPMNRIDNSILAYTHFNRSMQIMERHWRESADIQK